MQPIEPPPPVAPSPVRTNVYIDGFNFYYGAVKDTPHKWLNFDATIRSMRQRLADLRRETAALEAELRAAGVELRGKKARGDKASAPADARRRPIKERSNVGFALNILRHEGHPVHIDSLLKYIEQLSGLTVRKTTLVSNLSRYVRANDTFTRPDPSMYGLVEWETKEGD